MSGYRMIKNFFPESETTGFNQLFTPANINCVSKVSSPISVFSPAYTPLEKITNNTIKNKELGIFNIVGEKISLLPDKDSSARIKQGTKGIANVIKKGTKKIKFSQAMKRFKFSGRAKFLSVILAAGFVSFSALASD